MAVKFLTAEYAYINSQSWLDGITSLSFHCRVRFDTIGAGSQFIFRHRTGTSGDQISLRRDSGGKLRWSVTCDGGVNSSTRDSAFTPAAGTTYDIVCTWQIGQATGMYTYLNGVLDASGSSTTGQTAYNTSGGDLFIAARKATPATEYGQCTLEEFTLWPNVVLTATQALALYEGAWPHQIGEEQPGIYLPMFGDQISTLIDWSGNDRKIVDGNTAGSPATDIVGGATNVPLLTMQDPLPDDSMWIQAATTGSGPPQPNPWTQYTPDVEDPQTSVVISGLTPATVYEFYVVHIDDTGNISADSDVVEATPTTVTSSIIAPAPWRRNRYLRKYRGL